MSEEDAEALRGVASGRPEALRAVMDRYEARVYHFTLALMRSRDKAADVVQDAFLVLLRSPESYDPGRGSLLSYLIGIARNLALREFRRAKREAAGRIPEGREPGVEAGLVGREDARRLASAVGELSEAQKQVVAMRFQAGMPLQGIADAMLLPLNTVKSHLKRGVERLRKMMREEGGSHGL